jgi:hypothetical protein
VHSDPIHQIYEHEPVLLIQEEASLGDAETAELAVDLDVVRADVAEVLDRHDILEDHRRTDQKQVRYARHHLLTQHRGEKFWTQSNS